MATSNFLRYTKTILLAAFIAYTAYGTGRPRGGVDILIFIVGFVGVCHSFWAMGKDIQQLRDSKKSGDDTA